MFCLQALGTGRTEVSNMAAVRAFLDSKLALTASLPESPVLVVDLRCWLLVLGRQCLIPQNHRGVGVHNATLTANQRDFGIVHLPFAALSSKLADRLDDQLHARHATLRE